MEIIVRKDDESLICVHCIKFSSTVFKEYTFNQERVSMVSVGLLHRRKQRLMSYCYRRWQWTIIYHRSSLRPFRRKLMKEMEGRSLLETVLAKGRVYFWRSVFTQCDNSTLKYWTVPNNSSAFIWHLLEPTLWILKESVARFPSYFFLWKWTKSSFKTAIPRQWNLSNRCEKILIVGEGRGRRGEDILRASKIYRSTKRAEIAALGDRVRRGGAWGQEKDGSQASEHSLQWERTQVVTSSDFLHVFWEQCLVSWRMKCELIWRESHICTARLLRDSLERRRLNARIG